jgi:hypothetical protein
MSYIINKTDGTVLTEVVDGSIDQTTTDLTLIGKNSSTYGELFNENFVHLLENFANTTEPNHPIAGQLWFDTTENRLKVYDGSGFRVSGGTVVAASAPSGLVQGDIWIDSYRKQLFFYDGTQLTLAGPLNTDQQGLTGFEIESVLDTNNLSHTIALLYVSQALIGIFSKDEFTPATTISGFSGRIYPGWNNSTLSGIQFRTTATNAKQLIAADGSFKTAESFIQTTGDVTVNGKFTLLSTTPLIMGISQNNEIRVDSSNYAVASNITGQGHQIKIKDASGIKTAIQITALTNRVGIFTETPAATLDVAGDTIIRGNLTVEGSNTTINSTTVSVDDIAIELAKTDVPTDTFANGGGIILKGTTDHSITWNKDSQNIAYSNWNFTENISVATGKSYKVNNIDVLSATALGNTVATAPGLRSVGNLLVLDVNNLHFVGNTISVTDNNGNIILDPPGTGNISASSSRITNIANPVDSGDAVNLGYFQQQVTGFPIGLQLDISTLSAVALTLRSQIATILNDVFPARDRQPTTVCKVYATRQTISYPSIALTYGGNGSGSNIIVSSVTVNKAALQENQTVVQDIATNPINAGNATVSYVRTVFVFAVSGTGGAAAWIYQSDTPATTLPT